MCTRILLVPLAIFILVPTSEAQNNWFVELAIGQTDIHGSATPAFEVLTFFQDCFSPRSRTCRFDTPVGGLTPKNQQFGKLAVGRKFGKWSIDVSYLDIGDFEANRTLDRGEFLVTESISIDIGAVNVSAGRELSLFGKLSMFGKVGIVYFENDTDETTIATNGREFAPGFTTQSRDFNDFSILTPKYSRSRDDDGVEINYSIGLLYQISEAFDVKLEYQAFPNFGEVDLKTISLGLAFNF